MRKLPTRSPRERRPTSLKQRRQHHLLDVRVRAHIAAEQRTRRIMSVICWLIVIGSVSFGAIYGVRTGLRKLLWENPKYRVHEIAVSDDGALSRERVMAVSGVRTGESIFSVNLAAARERLEKLSQIASVDVRRVWPDKIEIAVNERKPVARVAQSGPATDLRGRAAYLLDARGVLFRSENDGLAKSDLPVISGLALDEDKVGEILDTMPIRSALDLLLLNSGNPHLQISNIDISKGYCLVVSDRHHVQVLFGLENIAQQLERFSLLMEKISATPHAEIRTVNLLVQRNIPVTFFPTASESANDGTGEGDAATMTEEKASLTRPDLAKRKTDDAKKPANEKRHDARPKERMVRKERTIHHGTKTKRAEVVRRAQLVNTD